MLHSATLIFNPVAGSGDSDEDLQRIKQCLESEIELKVLQTTEETSAKELAETAIEKGADCVIASGGDGTVSQVAGVLVGSDISLGIVARGTANAFANALDIPTNIEEACHVILTCLKRGTERLIDIGKCNGEPMLLLTGVGFEAETVDDADRESKDRWGMLAYFFSGMKQLQEMEPFQVELETEDRIVKVEAVAITAANTAPPSSILAQGPAGIIADDGLLDITILAPRSQVGAIAAAYHLLQSAFHEDGARRDDIGYLRANWIKIRTDPPQKVVIDGEVCGETPIEIDCIPQKLKLFVPGEITHEQTERLDNLPGVEIHYKNEQEKAEDGHGKDISNQPQKSEPDVIVIDYRIPD
ncbi:MAG: YegS/Rv2252/BmrU family lipid kinase [Microcoleaceae cyanobacterium]